MLVCKRVNLVQPACVQIYEVSGVICNTSPRSAIHPTKVPRKIYSILVLPETNMAPARRPSQKETHLPTPVIHVLC